MPILLPSNNFVRITLCIVQKLIIFWEKQFAVTDKYNNFKYQHLKYMTYLDKHKSKRKQANRRSKQARGTTQPAEHPRWRSRARSGSVLRDLSLRFHSSRRSTALRGSPHTTAHTP